MPGYAVGGTGGAGDVSAIPSPLIPVWWCPIRHHGEHGRRAFRNRLALGVRYDPDRAGRPVDGGEKYVPGIGRVGALVPPGSLTATARLSPPTASFVWASI